MTWDQALIWCLVGGISPFLVAPIHASDLREVEKVEDWTIIHDPAGDGSCYAKATYGKETTLALGKSAPNAAWTAVVSNPAFGQIQPGAAYEIRYVFGTKYVWSEKAIGTPEGLRSDEIGEEFVDDFARAVSLKLVFQGRNVDSFKLPATSAAVEAINRCYVAHALGTAPYAESESSGTQ